MSHKADKQSVVVYLEHQNEQVVYTVNVLFRFILKLPYVLVSDIQDFRLSERPKINYSQERKSSQEIFIPTIDSTALGYNLLNDTPVLSKYNKIPAFFELRVKDADLPFDLFKAAFYLLARIEEYHPFNPDKHGRFPASEALLVKCGLQQIPLVDIWAKLLLETLQKKFPQLKNSPSNPTYLPTYDIDLPWKYLNRIWWRSASAFGRDLIQLNFPAVKERLSVLSKKKLDPFYTFEKIEAGISQKGLSALFFIPVGDYGPMDKNIHSENENYQSLIRKLEKSNRVGLHLSYRSFEGSRLVPLEKTRLEQIINREVDENRFHYLRFRLPDSYRSLISAGIRHDYSMGFAELVGFRAGTAHSFPWFDYKKNQVTDLIIHPFAFMDVSLKNYEKLNPEEAIKVMRNLAKKVDLTGGQLISIWHNNSLESGAEWGEWAVMYKKWIASV